MILTSKCGRAAGHDGRPEGAAPGPEETVRKQGAQTGTAAPAPERPSDTWDIRSETGRRRRFWSGRCCRTAALAPDQAPQGAGGNDPAGDFLQSTGGMTSGFFRGCYSFRTQ